MAKFIVAGANAHTGRDEALEITAPDEASARELARDRNILVSRVYPYDSSGERILAGVRTTDANAVPGPPGPAAGERPVAAERPPSGRSVPPLSRPDLTKVSLRGDFETISTIAVGVALGIIIAGVLAVAFGLFSAALSGAA